MRSTFTGLACALMAAFGCAPAESDALDRSAGASATDPSATDAVVVDQDRAAPAGRAQHLASGYLTVDDSPILPWCNAVLIAPDVVLTSAHCVDGVFPEALQFGIGSTNGERADPVDVLDIVEHPDADRPGHGLAALTLAEPILAIEPAGLAANPRSSCGLSTIANRFVARGTAGKRWSWDGCLKRSADAVRLVAERGAPNCHGDEGAGVFQSGSDDTLVALSVASLADTEPAEGCVDSVALAPVADNLKFLDLALGLSRPPT